ncbi:1,4-alpha-glucan branching protein [Streptomyces sp. TRM64462]|uniref:maltokinase N-terminal cap-like domain-containing protein n=1 Tax=Streptomyces sp. TRM64462 TaxID=2741726 RepID=UPI001586BB69|nr:1,4-alpha-glucan branching protein [Streptomyces sp. TRM64462]
MSIIHKTTMSPTKTELLAGWLPRQPWYAGVAGREPELDRAGGFRLDDPEGEVGIEFLVVTDTSGGEPCSYHVPLTYRGAPLEGADDALIGTTEHGVLGTRWVYDGTQDPVLVAQVLALVQGEAEPQAQSESDTPDPTVTARLDGKLDADRVALETVRVPGASDDGALGSVTARWSRTEGESSRGVFFLVRER